MSIGRQARPPTVSQAKRLSTSLPKVVSTGPAGVAQPGRHLPDARRLQTPLYSRDLQQRIPED